MYAKHFIYTFLALFTSIATWAQFQFRAEVLNKSIGIDQTTEVRFVMNDTKAESFIQPLFKDFDVKSKITSSKSQYKNGIAQIEYSCVFILNPLKTGVLIIDSASITYQGKVYKTEPILIQVGVNDVEKKYGSEFEVHKDYSTKAKYFEPILLSKEKKDLDFHAIANLRSSNIYVNEIFAVEYGLLAKERSSLLTNFTYRKVPVYNDSLLVGVIGEKKISFQPKMIKIKSGSKELNKKDYFYAPLVTYYLKPQQLGTVEIVPVEFEIETTDTITKIVNKKLYVSESKKINIVPIPVENQPKNFSGIFGNYKISLHLYTTDNDLDNTHFIENGKRVIKINEPIEIQIVITGIGGLPKESNFTKPQIITDLEYSLDLKEDRTKGVFLSDDGVTSITYSFTPKQKGKYTISTIDFPYFNTISNKYTTVSTEEIIIEAN